MEKELMDKIRSLEERVHELEDRESNNGIFRRFRVFLRSSFQKSNVVFGIFVTVLLFSGMLYALTKPFTFNPGDPASSAQVNANFDYLYDYVNSGVMAGLSSSQGISSGTDADLAFDTVLYGDSDFLNAGLNEINIQDSGVYRFSYHFIDTNSAGCMAYIHLNDATTDWSNHHVGEFSVGDTLKLNVYCSVTGNIVPSDASNDTFMMVKRIW